MSARTNKYYTDPILDLTFGIVRGTVVSVTAFPEHDDQGQLIKWPEQAIAE